MGFLKNIFSLGKDELYDEAMRFFNHHEYIEAIEKFEEILKKKTSSTSLHYNLARVYVSQSHRNLGIILFAMGNYTEALREFKRALDYNPGYHELNYFIGVCMNNLGDFSGAVKSFNSVLDVDPSNLPTRLKLGVALHNHKMWDKAVLLYKNMLLLNPQYADIHYNLGLAYLGQGRVEDAMKSFQEALEINPNYLQAKVKIAIVNIYIGNFEKALEELLPLTEKFPEYADIRYLLGMAYTGMSELEKAIEQFLEAISINPSYKEAKIKLGAIYCYFERYSDGINELEGASKIDSSDEDIVMLSNAIKNAFSAAPTCSGERFIDIYNRVFLKDHVIISTIPEFNRSVEMGPDMSEMISIIMSLAEEDRALCEMLIPFVKDHITENDDYPDLHNSLGALYLKIDRLSDAETSFRNAIRLNPNYMKARINLFHALKLAKKYREALEECEHIISHGVTYPDFYCVMAEVYLELGDNEKALDSVFKSLKISPDYARANYLAGRAFAISGERDEAIKYCKRCLDAKPSREILELTLEELKKLKEG